MLRALIFDFDGLILDTETPEFHAWQEIYRLHDTELAIEDWLPCIGTGSVFDPHSHLETLIGSSLDRQEVGSARKLCNERLLARETLRPGVLSTLQAARAANLRIGLASSSSRAWVEPHLLRLGIAEFFETLQTGDLVEEVKPHPELYRRALAALQVDASEAIALEDSLNGLRSARSAGIFTVVIPNAMTRNLDLREADMLLESMEELDLARWPFHDSRTGNGYF
jgi:HAD superfamily hydrolase (TIGR01509 family)